MKSQRKRLTASQIATTELKSYPNWQAIVATVKKEAREGKGITLEEYLAKRSKDTPRKKAA